MPGDSLTYNINTLPQENASFFKTFIRSQDGVVAPFGKTCFVGNSNDNLPEMHVKQVHGKFDSTYCTSVFYTGQNPVTNLAPKEIPVRNSDSFFYLMLFCLVLGTIILFVKHKRISQIFKAFYLPYFTNQLIREGLIQREFYSFPLLLIYYISLSMFIAQGLHFLYQLQPDFYFVMEILGAAVALSVLRSIVITLMKVAFKTYKETSEYNTNNFIFSIVTGIFLTPMVFMINYMNAPEAKILFFTVLLLTALLFFYRLVRSFLIGLSNEGQRLYYFILYLCTIEILPLVICVKLLSNLYFKGVLIV
ncbi:MAG TPA: DUF4271 domain-containing protein [Bacteroidales bacterium]|nr:DUF4271 domain-containing protein [Bacteroidales bacterium]HQI69177.1 DUF4271 domain-containing protein [Bacteroidales bacterium]